MRGLVLVAAAVSRRLAFAGAAPAASLTSLERGALAKLKRAPVSAETKTSARSEIARAAHLIRTLPNGRELSHPRRAAGGRVVPRCADAAACARVVRRAEGERRLLREALGAGRLDRHRRRRRRRVPLLRRTLLPVPSARKLRCAERARDVRRRRGHAGARRRARRTRRLPARAAASAGSTTSRSPAAGRRGSPGWLRRSRRRRSRAPRRPFRRTRART